MLRCLKRTITSSVVPCNVQKWRSTGWLFHSRVRSSCREAPVTDLWLCPRHGTRRRQKTWDVDVPPPWRIDSRLVMSRSLLLGQSRETNKTTSHTSTYRYESSGLQKYHHKSKASHDSHVKYNTNQSQASYYTVSQKGTSILLPITLADVDGFSKSLHCCIHHEICNKLTVTLSTTP